MLSEGLGIRGAESKKIWVSEIGFVRAARAAFVVAEAWGLVSEEESRLDFNKELIAVDFWEKSGEQNGGERLGVTELCACRV
ncbi:uncharacterized protein A4U43_UnF3310 [Asparagus officinalis]|uniref:Uncharacterized protein n=1 Tax=Asparagus officinalis TaxID=4686 RepID=A0A1R3L749_ASPOF|nr:uncharacterized protein A4U43_UnF3310 [Asparagus officinalis]